MRADCLEVQIAAVVQTVLDDNVTTPGARHCKADAIEQLKGHVKGCIVGPADSRSTLGLAAGTHQAGGAFCPVSQVAGKSQVQSWVHKSDNVEGNADLI